MCRSTAPLAVLGHLCDRMVPSRWALAPVSGQSHVLAIVPQVFVLEEEEKVATPTLVSPQTEKRDSTVTTLGCLRPYAIRPYKGL